jgi:hypothetical protein
MAASQPVEYTQRSYEVFEKKHDMECTTPMGPNAAASALSIRPSTRNTPAAKRRRRPPSIACSATNRLVKSSLLDQQSQTKRTTSKRPMRPRLPILSLPRLTKIRACRAMSRRVPCAGSPKKKPQGQVLTIGDRLLNHLLSSARVVVENGIAGVKRCRIVKDVLRLTTEGSADLVMEVACGLHNLRVSCRHPLPICDVLSFLSSG